MPWQVLWALLCIMPLSGAEIAHADPSLSVVFPATLATYTFAKIDHFDDARLGYALSYAGANGEVADIYVYDLGLAGIGSGPNDPQVKTAVTGALADIREVQSLGYYEAVTLEADRGLRMRELTKGHWHCTSLALTVNATLTAGGALTTARTHLLVTSLRGKLIKIRCTHAQSDPGGDASTGAFANAVALVLALP